MKSKKYRIGLIYISRQVSSALLIGAGHNKVSWYNISHQALKTVMNTDGIIYNLHIYIHIYIYISIREELA